MQLYMCSLFSIILQQLQSKTMQVTGHSVKNCFGPVPMQPYDHSDSSGHSGHSVGYSTDDRHRHIISINIKHHTRGLLASLLLLSTQSQSIMLATCNTLPQACLRPSSQWAFPRALERMYSQSSRAPTVAVLFQDIDPPIINGVRKPRKPGGR